MTGIVGTTAIRRLVVGVSMGDGREAWHEAGACASKRPVEIGGLPYGGSLRSRFRLSTAWFDA
jgi:hypothetical protein